MLEVLNYFTKVMEINTILVFCFTTLSSSTQLLDQRQTVTDNAHAVTKNIGNAIGIGVSPQLTAKINPKHNE